MYISWFKSILNILTRLLLLKYEDLRRFDLFLVHLNLDVNVRHLQALNTLEHKVCNGCKLTSGLLRISRHFLTAVSQEARRLEFPPFLTTVHQKVETKNAVAIRTAPVQRLVFAIRTGVRRFHRISL